MKIGKDVLDLKAGNELEVKALTASVAKSLQLVIDCYQGKVEEIQKSLKKAEAWMVQAKELMGRESVKMEEIEAMLKTAEDVGVENEDISKKIRAELGRCRAWGIKADAALHESTKPSVNAMKKLIAEGEKIKVKDIMYLLFTAELDFSIAHVASFPYDDIDTNVTTFPTNLF